MQQLMDALSSPIRREILWLVRERELPAGDIAAAFAVTPSTISEHLAVLRAAGLVQMRVDGSFRRYRAEPSALEAVAAEVMGRGRWVAADDLPETQLATGARSLAVTVETDLAEEQADAFRAFVEPAIYSRWLGVPVTLENGHFAATMEWGTAVRGTYEVVVPPELLALRWDFADEAIPIPGAELITYVRFEPSPPGTPGSRVVVHQLAADEEQAAFLEVAWSMVLGRLREGLGEALRADVPARPRPRRSKRRP